ncbi:PIH1 domain-containing protein 2 [Myripristis murdjan]|uniref:PIH1 domain-containing protein 2 n=1 Tax=Myripristis murdjan TaxID=586833 RepID=A0A667XU86_9TELE|nr:PIH1 domain-containing protein 2 [Myripristis murdjan]
MGSSGCPEDVLQHVSQFWSMLDDLSESDPAAYQELIGKQMERGADMLSAPPEPVCCLQTEILEPNQGLLYINICGWKRVPAPQDPSKPIPLCGGRLETHTDQDGELYNVLDVALSPVVLQESKKDERKKNHVYTVALSFAQQQHRLSLSHQYAVISCSLKGSLHDLHRRLGFRQQPCSAEQPNTVTQTPASLLQQLSSLHTKERDEDLAAQLISRPAENNKKTLIQVISSTVTAQPLKPEYQLQVNTDAAGSPCSLELTVELPRVSSISECQLSISKDDILLQVEDVYYLLLELPQNVNEESAAATFNKKKRRLTLKVPVL